jgi:DNA-damage-inducible protein D
MSDTHETTAVELIEEQAEARIRRVFHNGRWFFSVVDVIALLIDSADLGAYWRKFKQRMREDEGAIETVTNCHTLRMTAADGKQRLTDAADTETLLRIIQSVPSPKAEPVKQRLARVGAKRLDEVTWPIDAA